MQRLFIANRGEIAIRIARTARAMGLACTGVRASDERDPMHTAHMDAVITLPGAGAAAYLDTGAVVAAARDAGADAVHPGYGFLSEQAGFAEAVQAAGIVFIGPAPETLALFGDKVRARALATRAGVPVLAGTDGAADLAQALAFRDGTAAGRTVILKAVAGGGGRGVRIVRPGDDLEAAFASAAREAQAAFGDGALYAEVFLERARHVEVQLAGDGAGTVSVLGDRDCTLQRRHQKLIEIAPAPALEPATRASLHDAARRLGEASGLASLATIEFLLDPKTGEVFFIEANARLQVEHTVTEAVTGLDLVAAQIALARGESLRDAGLLEDDLAPVRDVAIQARVCLETLLPDGSVRPESGEIRRFDMPGGARVRVDHAGHAGLAVTGAYDSLIAKVIVTAPGVDATAALAPLARALDETRIEGVASNLPVLKDLLARPELAGWDVHTRYIDEHLAELVAEAAPEAAGAQPVADASGRIPVRAPMTGRLVGYEAAVGEALPEGATLAILEAMKMEHEVRLPAGGVVCELAALPGEGVSEGAILALVEPADVSGDAETGDGEQDLDHIRPDLAEALARKAAGHDENRPEAVAKRHGRGHRTARENIADLCDPGSFVEYGSVVLAAQRRRRSMDDLIANTTGDGMVCGLGHVNGELFDETRSRVMAMSYDYMVLAGTQGALNHYKKDRMFEIARTQRLPVVLYAEGGGGRPGDTDTMGVAGLDCHAFNYFAQLSGLVPLVGITNGRCFAGNAVLLGCCDVIIATEGSNIGIGGPAMIEGGGLGVYAPEEVGPLDVQVANGVVDIAVKDEAEATAAAKQYLSYFQGPLADWQAPDPRALRHVVPENRKRWYDMRAVIEGIADTGSVMELRRGWAPGMITALIRVEGRPLGLIANDPSHLSGAVDTPGADKAARFLQLCDAHGLPVLSLVDCPGIMVGPEAETTALVRHASRLMVIGANLTVPMMSVIIRKGYGLGAQAMCGGSFRAPLFCVTWPTGEFGGMGLEGAVRLGYRKELETIEDPQERQRTYEEMVARMYERGKAVNMASHFELDDVIDPADTRAWILAGLKSLPPEPPRTGKVRPQVDTW